MDVAGDIAAHQSAPGRYVLPPEVADGVRMLIVPEMGAMAEHMTGTRAVALTAVCYLFVPLFVVGYARKAGPDEIRHVEWASLDIGQ